MSLPTACRPAGAHAATPSHRGVRRGPHRTAALRRSHGCAGYVAGAGLLTGGVGHSLVLAAVGLAVLVASAVLNEVVLADAAPPPTTVRVVITALLLGSALGSFSGGLQALDADPARASVLVPLGLVLGLAAQAARPGAPPLRALTGPAGAVAVSALVASLLLQPGPSAQPAPPAPTTGDPDRRLDPAPTGPDAPPSVASDGSAGSTPPGGRKVRRVERPGAGPAPGPPSVGSTTSESLKVS